MPKLNNFAITRQFPGGRNESEKITVFIQLEDGDKPGDVFKEVHSLVMDLDPFGPWSPEDVETATQVIAHPPEEREGLRNVGMVHTDARRILADHDEWKRRRNTAIDRLNQLGGTTDPKPSVS